MCADQDRPLTIHCFILVCVLVVWAMFIKTGRYLPSVYVCVLLQNLPMESLKGLGPPDWPTSAAYVCVCVRAHIDSLDKW